MSIRHGVYHRGHLTVKELYEEKGEDWGLKLVGGAGGLEREIETDELCRPGLLFAGYEQHFARTRIQIIGMAEWSYLKNLPENRRIEVIRRLFEFKSLPAIIIAKNLDPLPPMKEMADSSNIPLFVSKMKTTQLEHFVLDYLWRKLSEYIILHADLVNINGVGVLIGGESGVGKSETALDLIHRGHALVADDLVKVMQYPPGKLLGMREESGGREAFANILHIRNIGFIDVFGLFGIRAIRNESPIDIYIELVKYDATGDGQVQELSDGENGLPVNPCNTYKKTFFGEDSGNGESAVSIDAYRIIVEPKKNAATLIEVIALHHIMKLAGADPLPRIEQLFEERSRH